MTRTYTPPLRSANPPGPGGNFTATEVDNIMTGLAGIANAAMLTKLVADSTARLALGSAVQVGDMALESGGDLYQLKALPASTSGNWTLVNGGGGAVSSVNTRTGAVTLDGSDIPTFGASGGGHAPGAVPDPGGTAGTARYLREDATFNVPTGNGLGIPPWYVNPFTPPKLVDFAWTNQASATAADQTAQLTMVSSGSGSNSVHILDQAYSVGNRAVLVLVPAFNVISTTFIAGIILRNSSNGKFLEFSITIEAGGMNLRGVAWNSPTDPSPTVLFRDAAGWASGKLLMLSVRSDGTNMFFDISSDGGQNWDNYFTETIGSFLLATDRAGFHSSSIQTSYSRVNFVHWSNS